MLTISSWFFAVSSFWFMLFSSVAAAEDVETAILGPWVLDQWTITNADGSVTYPYGPNAKGMLIYTDDGKMAVQLVNPDINVATLTTIEERYFAYYGSFTVDEANRTITHELESSISPTWVGTKQVRVYSLTQDGGLELTAIVPDDDDVAAAAGAQGTNALSWVRPD